MPKRSIKSKNNYAANDIIKCQMSCLGKCCDPPAPHRFAGPDCAPSPMPGNAPNLGKTLGDTTKCKAAARDVNGAASNLFKAIFQFIEVESIRKKKTKTEKKPSETKNPTKENKTRQQACTVRCGIASGFSRERNARACYTH